MFRHHQAELETSRTADATGQVEFQAVVKEIHLGFLGQDIKRTLFVLFRCTYPRYLECLHIDIGYTRLAPDTILPTAIRYLEFRVQLPLEWWAPYQHISVLRRHPRKSQ
ncbi:unnamed protein product [Nezara viridula]|uniref:Uncharacterized protein n=1 Tax=Nezara viridula TaxID=85310 RepID=A0A9P0HAN6_NEZVI|nr:unnamed protein product [Nezara viridula]